MEELEVKILRKGARKLTLLEDVRLFNVTIPKGFTCDGASVPRALWWVLSPLTDGMYAAIVHDYRLKEDAACPTVRREADREFYYNLRSSGLNIFRSYIVFGAVRIWSKLYLLHHRKGIDKC